MPPPAKTFCKWLPRRPVPASEGRPVTKSRASTRKDNLGTGVLKSSPPPNWNAPLVSELEPTPKCENPAPALTNGEIAPPGMKLTFSDGVNTNLENSESPTGLTWLFGAAMNGVSTKREATCAFTSRCANPPSTANDRLTVFVAVAGQTNIASQAGATLVFGKTLPPLRVIVHCSGQTSHRGTAGPATDRKWIWSSR